MVGLPNKPMGFPTKNDQHLGWRLGVPPFKETPMWGNYKKITHQPKVKSFLEGCSLR